MALRTTLLAAVAALAPASAIAQGATPSPLTEPRPAVAPRPMLGGPGNISSAARADQVEIRIKDLHARLKIMPDQEPQWSAFTDVMRANARRMSEHYRTGNPQDMTAPEALQRYAQIARAHSDEITALLAPFQILYAALSPAQKKLADEAFRSFQRRGTIHG